MPFSKADNAMSAIVHSLYGKRMTKQDYDILVQKRSVAEIANYLKTETYYAEALGEVKEDLVHREQLENLVNRNVWQVFMRLTNFSYTNKPFLKIYITQNEIKQLLFAIRLLNAGDMDKYIISMPAYLSDSLSIDLFKIAAAKNYDDFLQTLKKTEYYNILGRFRPVSSDSHADITACETALLTNYYDRITGVINERYSGEPRKDLQSIIANQIDFHNVTLIYRMKKYFHAGRDRIEDHLIKNKSNITKKIYDNMLDAPDFDAMTKVFEHQRLSKIYDFAPEHESDRMFFQIQQISRRLAKKMLRFSTEPVVALCCYMTLLEIEANNITNIIEGIRYNLTRDEMRSMLVV